MISNFKVEEQPMSSLFKIEDRCINMADKYITMVKGDTLSFGIELADETGAPVDITDAVFVARKTYNATASVFEKTLGNGITKVDDGIYSVRVAPEDTSDKEYECFISNTGDFYLFTVSHLQDGNSLIVCPCPSAFAYIHRYSGKTFPALCIHHMIFVLSVYVGR